jgi:enamine deaminase RidA (YjgF/YER057c/UK114 family)
MGANLRFSNPKTLAPPPGYSYVVESTGPSRTYYFAGQLGLDPNHQLVGGDFRSQVTRAFENLGVALASAGATFVDVVKINNYLTNMADLAVFREVRDQFLNTAAPPASTTVGVATLARPGALFEVEAIAVLPGRVARPARAAKTTAKRKTSAKKAAKKKSAPKAPARRTKSSKKKSRRR